MPKTEEYRDARGKSRIRHTADNGNVTYASSQGYENVKDARDAAINAALGMLAFYMNEKRLSTEQLQRLEDLGTEAMEILETPK